MSSAPPQPPSNQAPGQPPPYPPPAPGMDPRDYARAQKEYYKAWTRQQKDYWRANKDQWRAQRDQWRSHAWYGRRRSLVGPVILIAIGVIFLLIHTGHIEGFQAWAWFGRWWPAILIAAGIGRLVEWTIDRSSPYPPRSSGFVGLIVLIIIVGIVATSTSHFGWNNWGNNSFGLDNDDMTFFHGPEHDFEGQFWAALPAGDSLQIVSSVRGDISVTTTDSGTAPPPAPGFVMEQTGPVVYIHMNKKVHTGDQGKAQREADAFAPTVTYAGNVATIHLDPRSQDVGANMEVVVPADAALSIQSSHGDVTVAGMKANVTTENHHGDLRFSDLGGNLQINADHGDVTVNAVRGNVTMEGHFGDINVSGVGGPLTMKGEFPGDLNLRNIAGPLVFQSSRTTMEVARIADQLTIDSGDLNGSSLAGPFRLKTRDFNIDLTNVSGDVDIANSDGDVNLVAARPLGSINIDNRSSSIRVTLPPDAGFQLDAETQGEISNDFGIGTMESGGRKIARGTVGNGALQVNLKSNEDDISIRRGNDAVMVTSTGPMPAPSTQSPESSGAPEPPSPPKPPRRLTKRPTIPNVPAPPSPGVVSQ